uniref:Uncharacterized protein n=1 Tax=mine drainage metagenome TaxID=410659 RepID=E6PJC9_9ZZZZ
MSRIAKQQTQIRALFIRMAFRTTLAVIALVPCATITATARAQSLPSGAKVYSMAISAMSHLRLPPIITYDLVLTDHGLGLTVNCNPNTHVFRWAQVALTHAHYTKTFAVHYNSQSGLGTMFAGQHKFFECVPFPLGPAIRPLLRIGASRGTPIPAPTTSPEEVNTNSKNAPPLDLLKTIAVATTFYSKYYHIHNTGVENVGGAPAYHLQLTARDGNESQHPLTDMYVDTSNFLVRSLILGGGQRGFIVGGGGYGRFDFGSIGDYWLVRRIRVEASGHILFIQKHGALTLTFDHFTIPTTQSPK